MQPLKKLTFSTGRLTGVLLGGESTKLFSSFVSILFVGVVARVVILFVDGDDVRGLVVFT
jgi:hypothetical protein